MERSVERVLLKYALEDCFKKGDWRILGEFDNGNKALIEVGDVRLFLELDSALKEDYEGFFRVYRNSLKGMFRDVFINEEFTMLFTFNPFVIFRVKMMEKGDEDGEKG